MLEIKHKLILFPVIDLSSTNMSGVFLPKERDWRTNEFSDVFCFENFEKYLQNEQLSLLGCLFLCAFHTIQYILPSSLLKEKGHVFEMITFFILCHFLTQVYFRQ